MARIGDEAGSPAATLPEAVTLCDRDGNPSCADPPALPAEVAAAVREGCREASAAGRPAVREARAPADGDGAARTFECVCAPVPAGAGCDGRIVVIVRDVTRDRRREEALREGERRYRLLAENATDMITRHAPDGTYLYVSPASRAITGFEPAEMIGRTPYDFVLPDDRAGVRAFHDRILERDEPQVAEFRRRRADGSVVWLETTARAVRDPATGAVLEMQCAARDITGRKEAERAIREQRALMQAVLDNWPSPVYLKDLDGRYLLVNRPFEAMAGLEPGGAVGRTDAHLFPADRAAGHRAADRAAVEAGRAVELQEHIPAGPGAPARDLLITRFPLTGPDGHAYAVCGIAVDITARRQAEVALRDTSAVLRSVLDNMADGVIMADENERFLEFNPAAVRMFGGGPSDSTSDDWSGRYGLFLPDTVTPFPGADLPLTRALRGETVNDVEMFVRHAGRPDGLWILINGRPLVGPDGRPAGGVIVCRDITERRTAEGRLRDQNARLIEAVEQERRAHDALKQAEVQLVQAEKLAALGQMVAGFAHEVNNPLAFVSNDMAVLQRDVAALRRVLDLYRAADPALDAQAPDHLARIRELVEEVDLDYTLASLDRLTARSREGLRRIQQIVKDLRDFARPDEGDLKAVDLNGGVASTVNLILGKAKKLDVEVTTELGSLPPVTCYPGKINQVVLNLVMNALDACPPGRGRVTVRTEPGRDRKWARISVIDNGSGIPPEVRDRIFDPFFTTKPVGQGTGLGLSISYGIVQAHGGRIEVETEPGRGTTFIVTLPVYPPLPAKGDGPPA